MTRLLLVFTLIGMMAQTGCTIYQPPSPDSGKTAKIDVEDPHRFPLRLAIVEIDGAKSSSLSAYGLWRPPPTLLVTEGRHHFVVRFSAGTAHGAIKLWLDAIAGHDYTLKSASEGYRFTAWFVENGTDKPVGGIAGTEK